MRRNAPGKARLLLRLAGNLSTRTGFDQAKTLRVPGVSLVLWGRWRFGEGLQQRAHGYGGASQAFRCSDPTTNLLELLPLLLHVCIGPQPLTDLVEDLLRGRVGRLGQTIVHPLALAARGNNARSTQIGEMARNLRLMCSQNLYAETDAQLAVSDEIQQPESRPVGQCSKQK